MAKFHISYQYREIADPARVIRGISIETAKHVGFAIDNTAAALHSDERVIESSIVILDAKAA